MNFVALDLETANPDSASICQIGIACFEDGRLCRTWVTLIDPESYFHPMNVSVHGITDADVSGQPTFPHVFPEILDHLRETIVVHHSGFDPIALRKAARRYELEPIETEWLDSAKVVRRTWEEHSKRGYGLGSITSVLGISFRHHDALEDAIACGKVMVRAVERSGIALADWPKRIKQPVSGGRGSSVRRAGDPDGPLYGEQVVFTGRLSIARKKAAAIAAAAGCAVSTGVTRETTMLVVGTRSSGRTNGRQSAKERKAAELIAAGQSIAVVGEEDFMEIMELDRTTPSRVAAE